MDRPNGLDLDRSRPPGPVVGPSGTLLGALPSDISLCVPLQIYSVKESTIILSICALSLRVEEGIERHDTSFSAGIVVGETEANVSLTSFVHCKSVREIRD
ncbi:hypothetical protein BDR22DRAFT_825290 [Usnea florida]